MTHQQQLLDYLIDKACQVREADSDKPYDGFASRNEIEHSGYLDGLVVGLELAAMAATGRYGPEWLAEHHIPEIEPQEIDA